MTDPKATLETLAQIARFIRLLGPIESLQWVQLGVSDATAMTLLASVDAVPHTSHYFDGDRHEVIVSRTLMIDGVEFKAQSDRRPATPEERDAYRRAQDKEAKIAAQRAEIDALQGGAM